MEELIEAYILYLKETKGLASNTLEAYKRDIFQFKEYLDSNHSVKLIEVNKTQIITYLMFLQKENKAISTINRILSSLRCFYQYLLYKRIIKEDPTFNLQAPQREKKYPGILTAEEVELFLSMPKEEDFKGIRDKAMLELLYGTGVRVSELISLDVDDMNLDIGYIVIRESELKERVVPIGKTSLSSLKLYINNYREKVLKSESENALFLNYRGKRLTRQGFWKIVKFYTKKSNINKNITPQTLRHSFAVHLLQNGANVKAVQEILGHSNVSTTNYYFTTVDNINLKDTYNKTYPRA